ncbi:MAG: primosomal protein N' [Bacilli bacterium]|nr:primosomal protein N' [Bacilli bacterium]MDD4808738.1 primosomal protein N' [Bacilli bacterium]
MVIEVLVEIRAKQIDKTFTYLVPTHLESQVQVGIRVLVPFGKQELEGFVLKIVNHKSFEYELKEIIDIVDTEPVINEEMMELGEYISKKALSNLISAYQTMLPAALKAKKKLTVNKKYVSYIRLVNHSYLPKNIQQQELLNLIKDKEVLKSSIKSNSLKTLLNNGVVEEVKYETYRMNDDYEIEPSNIVLNNEQTKAVSTVTNHLNTFKPFLLYGVTGSGKTEVYMHIMEEVLKEKKEIIVLVPEISLTPQIVDLFRKRFGNQVAILHSRLNDGEKYDEWRKIERKEVSIVIGARSAIFAPFTNLGLIVIDEEHTPSYKQENTPKYNAIDIALNRAQKYHCPILLGSATPSIESYTRAKMGIYELLTIKKRVNNNLPQVELIDMKDEIKKGHRIISKKLKDEINLCLERNEQVIILLNRRGYSTVITCHACGYTDKCPNCDIPLTYHKTTNKMKCHYCNYENSKLVTCPECTSKDINQFGMGTQKLEVEIQAMFPQAKTVRMDFDTTSTKGAHEKIINAFKEEKYNILIGTQMVSKGLDFPKVTLVGVVNGDASLNIPDFRSAERTFQLLNQVAGRAGRANLPGLVIIQGFNITHYSITTAMNHDYFSFYKKEMEIRSLLKYPPFYNLTLIKIMSSNFELGMKESNKIASYLKSKLKSVSVLGPATANILKINNIYQIQIILKYKKSEELLKELTLIKDKYRTTSKVKIDIDINPIKL